MAKDKKSKDAKNKEVEKKNFLKHVDSFTVGKGQVEVFGFKPLGAVATIIMAVTVDAANNPTSVNFLEAHDVKFKSKKGNPSLVFENREKLDRKAEKRSEKKAKAPKEGKEAPTDKKKSGKKGKKED